VRGVDISHIQSSLIYKAWRYSRSQESGVKPSGSGSFIIN
jgi:hypothetical protein